jgi:hypothetical protein
MASSAPADDLRHELGLRSRAVGVVVWCSFLAAAIATMVCFAFIDPEAFRNGLVPRWWGERMQVYAIGFFFFWLIAALSATLTLYLARSERREQDTPH